MTLKTIIKDQEMLTFIDGEPLKASLLLRGSTVLTPLHRHQARDLDR